MNIAIIGTGYVGLVTGAAFAHFGHQVVFLDIDEDKIARLKEGKCPIFEPGLAEMLSRCESRIAYHTDPKEAVSEADVAFLCVGTPASEAGAADLTALLGAAKSVAPYLRRGELQEGGYYGGAILVVKSTVPAGTCRRVAEVIDADYDHVVPVLSNPEFLKEGDAVRDALRPDRIVIGTGKNFFGQQYSDKLSQLYAPFVRSPDQIQFMSRESAELAKYATNAHLAVRITLMQELARLCAATGADIDEVRRAVGADERIGSSFLYAGAGWGGSCFRKDLLSLEWQLYSISLEWQLCSNDKQQPSLISAITKSNLTHRQWFNELVHNLIAEDVPLEARDIYELPLRRVAVWGLAFKPETDDVRDAPALGLIRSLRKEGHEVACYDPAAVETARAALNDVEGIQFSFSAYSAAEGADALVLCTEWAEFRRPDFRHLREIMKTPAILVDGRNVWPRAAAEKLGFTYVGVGR